MTEPYDGWLKRKLAQAPIELRRSWTVSKKWERITGGRIMFGELTLSAAPSEAFSFVEKVSWPVDSSSFTTCVLDGILDGVFIYLGQNPSRMAFTLEDIKWHEENSFPHAYYHAAQDAVTEIFGKNEMLPFASFLSGEADA
jgi:hypothetical protein